MEQRSNYNHEQYTHEQYRSAGVARILNVDQKYEFYHRGKLIEKNHADKIVHEHLRKKNKK